MVRLLLGVVSDSNLGHEITLALQRNISQRHNVEARNLCHLCAASDPICFARQKGMFGLREGAHHVKRQKASP